MFISCGELSERIDGNMEMIKENRWKFRKSRIMDRVRPLRDRMDARLLSETQLVGLV